MKLRIALALFGIVLAAMAFQALSPVAQGGLDTLDVPSDGSDGDFAPALNVTIDLSQAPTAAWNVPSPQPGKGVYDPEKWAVVFKHRSVDIPAGVTVRFINHPKKAPVVWLVQGNVNIAGTVDVIGGAGNTASILESSPGPGGFRGGFGEFTPANPRSAGFGPGGGLRATLTGGIYAVPGNGQNEPETPYGNPANLPLLGGSGGASRNTWGGGAGGGAILIAAGGRITVDGSITARGGNGANNGFGSGGSGGAIRLVAFDIRGAGTLTATGGNGYWDGGVGRIRLESAQLTLPLAQSNPDYTWSLPGDPPLIWPPASSPSIRVTKVTGAGIADVPAPADPAARLDFPNADVTVETSETIAVEIEARNLPLDPVPSVRARVVPRLADDFTVDATFVSGDASLSLWRAEFTPPPGFAAITARADIP